MQAPISMGELLILVICLLTYAKCGPWRKKD